MKITILVLYIQVYQCHSQCATTFFDLSPLTCQATCYKRMRGLQFARLLCTATVSRRLNVMAYSVEERGSLYSTDYRLYFSQ